MLTAWKVTEFARPLSIISPLASWVCVYSSALPTTGNIHLAWLISRVAWISVWKALVKLVVRPPVVCKHKLTRISDYMNIVAVCTCTPQSLKRITLPAPDSPVYENSSPFCIYLPVCAAAVYRLLPSRGRDTVYISWVWFLDFRLNPWSGAGRESSSI